MDIMLLLIPHMSKMWLVVFELIVKIKIDIRFKTRRDVTTSGTSNRRIFYLSNYMCVYKLIDES